MEDNQSPNDQAPAEGQEQESKPDPINNLKAEFNRKIENSNQQLLAAIENLKNANKPTPPPPGAPKKISDLIFEDADQAAELIEQRAEERVMKRINQQQNLNNTFTQLYNDYPELSDDSSELTKMAKANLAQHSVADRQNPVLIKLAARDAAAELGVMPKSKRGSGDDYSFGGTGSSRGGKSPSKSKEDPADALILETAANIGLDIENPKVKERLLSRKRSPEEWLQYRGKKKTK